MTTTATEKKTAAKTAYMVLRKRDVEIGENGNPVYALVGEFIAGSADAAIRQHANTTATANAGAGTYIAIPARSFVEKTVKVETQTVVTLA